MAERVAPATTTKFPHLGVLAVKVDGLAWCFDTGVGSSSRFVWKWEERHNGNNLGMLQPSGQYTFQLYAKTLLEAVTYATGFTYGWYARGLLGIVADSDGNAVKP